MVASAKEYLRFWHHHPKAYSVKCGWISEGGWRNFLEAEMGCQREALDGKQGNEAEVPLVQGMTGG